MDIIGLARVLWRRKWMILGTAFVAGLLTVFLLQFRQNRFQSVSQISTGYTVSDQYGFETDNPALTEIDVQFSNLMALMNSPISFNLLSYRLLLHDLDSPQQRFRDPRPVPVYYSDPGNGFHRVVSEIGQKIGNIISPDDPSVYEIWEFFSSDETKKVKEILHYKLEHLLPLKTNDPDYELIRKYYLQFGYGYTDVRENTTIGRIPNSDFLQVSFVSENSKLSAYAANVYTEEFIRYYTSLLENNSVYSVAFLEEMVNRKKEDLDGKLDEFYTGSVVSLPSIPESGAMRLTQISELENQRYEILSRIEGLKVSIARRQDQIDEILSPVANGDNQRILQLQGKIDDLNVRFITSGSSNIRLLDSLTLLRGQLSNALMGNGGTPVVSAAQIREQIQDADVELQVEQKRLNLLDAQIAELKAGLSGYASREARNTAIQSEVDLASTEYQEAVSRYNEAKSRQLVANTLKQELAAIPAISSVSLRDLYIVAFAVAGSVAFCVFLIVFREVSDLSIRTPSRFRRMVKLPLLGILTRTDKKLSINTIYDDFSDTGKIKRLDTHRSLLRQIRFEIESMNGKILLFTSLKPGEGKTFLIISLSYVLSLLNKRILIIDSNFKNNSLTKIYESSEKKEVSSSSSETLLKRLIKPVKKPSNKLQVSQKMTYDPICRTNFKNIFLARNSGTSNNSPSEILSENDFRNFIKEMASRFDYILMEGAALNKYTDTKELISYADKVIAVFAADSVLDSLDHESMAYLRSLDGKFGGAILNKVEVENLNM